MQFQVKTKQNKPSTTKSYYNTQQQNKHTSYTSKQKAVRAYVSTFKS